MCGVSSNHEDPHVENVASRQHNLPLAVRVFVRGVFVERHLGSEAALLSWNCQVDDTNKERLTCEAKKPLPKIVIYSITCCFPS